MAFQFKRDRQQNLQLTIAGDIDLEVTPDIKTQLTKQLDDARGLTINAANVSYMDSSGVSVLIIAMQTCKKARLNFTIEAASDELMRVLTLAKLDKILPIATQTGPAQALDIDVFSNVSEGEAKLAMEEQPFADGDSGDDALIAALAEGKMGMDSDDADIATDIAAHEEVTPEPEDMPPARAMETAIEPAPAPASTPAPAVEKDMGETNLKREDTPENSGTAGGSTGFKPGTFS